MDISWGIDAVPFIQFGKQLRLCRDGETLTAWSVKDNKLDRNLGEMSVFQFAEAMGFSLNKYEDNQSQIQREDLTMKLRQRGCSRENIETAFGIADAKDVRPTVGYLMAICKTLPTTESSSSLVSTASVVCSVPELLSEEYKAGCVDMPDSVREMIAAISGKGMP